MRNMIKLCSTKLGEFVALVSENQVSRFCGVVSSIVGEPHRRNSKFSSITSASIRNRTSSYVDRYRPD